MFCAVWVSARSLHDRAVRACVSVWAWCFELHRSDLSLVLLIFPKRVPKEDGEGIRLVLASWDFIGFRVLVSKN